MNGHLSLHLQHALLQKLQADIILLQEVQDVHHEHGKTYSDWPIGGQVNYFSQSLLPHVAYGKNAQYANGHHGNVILSRFPITHYQNHDISAHAVEQRGMLHCITTPTGWKEDLHVICIHLGLLARWRHAQLNAIATHIESTIPKNTPLVIAGDFNDWSSQAGRSFAKRCHLTEVFEKIAGTHARSFPAWLPMLKLDRIYTRGFDVLQADIHAGKQYAKLSDHAALSAFLRKSEPDIL